MYHAHCFDGLSSAWVSTLFFRKRREGHVPIIPVRASATWEELVLSCPQLTSAPRGMCCLFVDVAPTQAVVSQLRMSGVLFGIIDHHKSNERELAIPEAFYNMERAGCILSYQYFFGPCSDVEIPWILLYLEDQDTFRWRRGRDSYMFHLAWSSNVARTQESVFPMLNLLCQRNQEAETTRLEMIRQGYILQSFVEHEAERVVADSKVMMISFLPGAPAKVVLIANYNSSLMHDVAQELVSKSYDLVVFWRKSSKTKLYHSTLVTSEGRGIDVSILSQVIASHVGGTGGGHALCSGMQTVIQPETILQRNYGGK